MMMKSRYLFFSVVVVVCAWIGGMRKIPPVLKFLRSIEVQVTTSGLKGVDCIYVINLDERPERWAYVKKCFDEQGLRVQRVSAINGWRIPLKDQKRLKEREAPLVSAGALGCLLSHVSIYQDAVKRGFDTIWICEDDITFKENKEVISSLLEELNKRDPDWDILYTDYSLRGAGVQAPRPGQSLYAEIHQFVTADLVRIHGRFNTHSMLFSKKGAKKALDYFSRVRVKSPIDVDIHYIPGLREYSARRDIVTSINDSSLLALDGSSDTQEVSSLR